MAKGDKTMAAKNPLNEWLDRTWSSWETNFDKYEGRIRAIFNISLVTCPLFFGLAVGGGEMNWGWVFGFAISFWALFITGSLLYRNSSKAEISRRLGNIEQKADKTNILLEAIAKKIGVDTDALFKTEDKNGSPKPKQR